MSSMHTTPRTPSRLTFGQNPEKTTTTVQSSRVISNLKIQTLSMSSWKRVIKLLASLILEPDKDIYGHLKQLFNQIQDADIRTSLQPVLDLQLSKHRLNS